MTKHFLQPDNDKINLKRKQNKVVDKLLASREILRSTIKVLKRNDHPEKPLFSGHFWIWRPKKFFMEIRLCHILGITILHLCVKIQKIPMVQSQKIW